MEVDRPVGYLAIVKRSVLAGDVLPALLMAVMSTLYAPALSFLTLLMRPSKCSTLLPLRPCTRNVPSVSVRVQRGLPALPGFRATHLPETLRPIAVCRNTSVTRAAASSLKLKFVPTGTPPRFTVGFAVPETLASLLPSSHRPPTA